MEPIKKSYWSEWKDHQAVDTSLYTIPEEPTAPYTSPRLDEPRSLRAYEYAHKIRTPRYLDSFDQPYAVFVFKYRCKDDIENELNMKVPHDLEYERAILQTLTVDQLVERVLQANGDTNNRSLNTEANQDWDVPSASASSVIDGGSSGSFNQEQDKWETVGQADAGGIGEQTWSDVDTSKSNAMHDSSQDWDTAGQIQRQAIVSTLQEVGSGAWHPTEQEQKRPASRSNSPSYDKKGAKPKSVQSSPKGTRQGKKSGSAKSSAKGDRWDSQDEAQQSSIPGITDRKADEWASGAVAAPLLEEIGRGTWEPNLDSTQIIPGQTDEMTTSNWDANTKNNSWDNSNVGGIDEGPSNAWDNEPADDIGNSWGNDDADKYGGNQSRDDNAGDSWKGDKGDGAGDNSWNDGGGSGSGGDVAW